MMNTCWIIASLLLLGAVSQTLGDGAVALSSENFDSTLASNQTVFLNFYASWCQFSRKLAPIFEEAAQRLHAKYPEPGRVLLGTVDCVRETTLAERFHINKYPTLKLVVNGQPARHEYRGARTADAFVRFIEYQLAEPVHEIRDRVALERLQKDEKPDQQLVIGYFDHRLQFEYQTFKRVAARLRDDQCRFLAGFGETVARHHLPGVPKVLFRVNEAGAVRRWSDVAYEGGFGSSDELGAWAERRCVPTVREITFANAEQLTDEDRTLVILFHRSGDEDSVLEFARVVEEQLGEERKKLNFLHADAKSFSHPLQHLRKTPADLPLIVIDTFRHMYAFPHYPNIHQPGVLKTFIQQLHIGQLHRDFHRPKVGQQSMMMSTFVKLKPSKTRYSLLRDEL